MPSETEICVYYESLGMPPHAIREIDEMRRESPSRKVGTRALLNFKVDLFSSRNAERRKLESLSAETAFAIELELAEETFAYYPQVCLRGVRRGPRSNSSTADFMVFDSKRVRIVECKPQAKLRELCLKRPDEWIEANGTWRRPPLEDWARERGLTYQIWSPPEPQGVYIANLMLMYAMHGADLSPFEERAIGSLIRKLRAGSLSVATGMLEVDGLTFRAAVVALARRQTFGALRSCLLDTPEHFRLYSSAEQARRIDEELLANLRSAFSTPSVTSALLLASQTDYRYAQARLARVERMEAGDEPITRRYRALLRRVLLARGEGRSALEACLTHYSQSGRRCRQLTALQEQALSLVIRRFEAYSGIRTKAHLHYELEKECLTRGVRTPSRTTLNARIRALRAERRALKMGGKRAFHAVREAVEPGVRNVDCRIPFLKVHVDSTTLDHRSLAVINGIEVGQRPTLYLASDAATGLILGRALLFGKACRDALAVLIRDIVWRHHRLPTYWLMDGGSEYCSHWFERFCSDTGASRLQPPSGAPRHNSAVENLLGRANQNVAHELVGSTEPDKQGRRVDAKFKSYATARHCFLTVVKEIDTYLFDDLAHTPIGIGRSSPLAEFEERSERLGLAGKPQELTDDFKIMTSIPLLRDASVCRVRGIRHEGRTYSSADLFESLQAELPIEKRRDAIDPTLMYVKFPSRWVMASSSDALRLRSAPIEEQLFETLTGPGQRIANRAAANAVSKKRFDRLDLANASLASTEHLQEEMKGANPAPLPEPRWVAAAKAAEPYEFEVDASDSKGKPK